MTKYFLKQVHEASRRAFTECHIARRPYSVINHPLMPPGQIWIVNGRSFRGVLQ